MLISICVVYYDYLIKFILQSLRLYIYIQKKNYVPPKGYQHRLGCSFVHLCVREEIMEIFYFSFEVAHFQFSKFHKIPLDFGKNYICIHLYKFILAQSKFTSQNFFMIMKNLILQGRKCILLFFIFLVWYKILIEFNYGISVQLVQLQRIQLCYFLKYIFFNL